MAEQLHVALVDDDSAVLDSLRLYFARQDIKTSCFESAEALLAALDREQPDCIVSDIRMEGMSGLELLHRLNEQCRTIPFVLITGLGDIDMAVSAIKNGASDFIEKPFDEARLLASIRGAVSVARQKAERATEVRMLRALFLSLSARQRQVMELVAAGLSNKEIGQQLDISPKTVEDHRAWVMERMGAKSLAELVRIALKIEEHP